MSIPPPLRFLVPGVFAVAPFVNAGIALTADYAVRLPVGHEYVIGLTFDPSALNYDAPRITVITKTEAWSFAAATPSASPIPIFDPNFAGVRMYEQSHVAYDPVTKHHLFSGGLFDSRIYTFVQASMSVTQHGALSELIDLPDGMAIRNGTGDFFASARNNNVNFPDRTPGLYRYTTVANVGTGDVGPVTGTRFGDTGAGAVSNRVGAMLFGPDGRLNVLDVGLQKILRYDPDTLAYLDAISLVNATTDGTSFAISSTGHIFTANTGGTSGVIYDYLTGDYLGTFTGMEEGAEVGARGKLAMTADDAGNVYVTNTDASAYVSVFSTAAVPEPATYGLLGAGTLAGLAAVRRRKR